MIQLVLRQQVLPWLAIVFSVAIVSHRASFAEDDLAAPVLAPPNIAPTVNTPEPILTPATSDPLAEVLVETQPQPEKKLIEINSDPEPVWYQPSYWFGPAPWDIGVEFGLNGNSGTNESLSMRAGGHLKRETDFWKFDSSLAYNRNDANGVETQNNALLDVRIDRLLGESPWTLFFLNQDIYDEFQAYDLRVSLNTGVGYQLIDTDTKNLTGRFGAGTSREFGGPDEDWAPEALFGLDYDHKLSSMQRLTAKVDYFPEWDDFNRYRIVTNLGWEIDLDKPRNLSLKFSIIDQYDSTPNGAEPNEINYAALLIWGIK